MSKDTKLYPNVSPLQELRADVVLTAAWVASAEIELQMAAGYSLYFTYDGDAAAVNPAFQFQIQVSPYADGVTVPTGAEEWYTMVLYSPGAVVAGNDIESNVQREYITYQPTGLDPEAFVYPIELLAVVERLRVLVRESGDVANPGNLHIEGLAG